MKKIVHVGRSAIGVALRGLSFALGGRVSSPVRRKSVKILSIAFRLGGWQEKRVADLDARRDLLMSSMP